MNTLPLQQWVIAFRWEYNGNLRDKKISKLEAARDNLNGEIIRIGRDKQSCNLYLEDISVSAQHAEIYFNEQQQKFFIRSLKPNINLKVDGQDIVHGKELPLKENSTIVLGLQKIEITDIQIYELQSTNYSGIVNSTPNSIPVNSSQNLSHVSSTNSNTDNKSKSWQDQAIVGAVATILVGIVTAGVTWYTNSETRKTEVFKTKETLKVEKEKVELQNYSAEKLKYIERLTAHKAAIIASLEKDENKNLKYRRLILKNECSETISIAATFEAPNGIQQTRGWLNIRNGVSASPEYYTLKSFIYLYAAYYQKNNKINDQQIGQKKEPLNAENFKIWSNKKGLITLKTDDGFVERYVIYPSDFNYIENPLFFDKENNEIIGKATFYTIQLPVETSGRDSTEKTFTCSENSLQLKDGIKK